MMQHLNTLSQIVNAASTVAEFARSAQTYTYTVGSSATCYLHLKGGEVRINRSPQSLVEITSQLQAPFGWRISTEQDDAGVYFVALRRPVVGAMSSAVFSVTVPQDAYLVLKLDQTRLSLDNVTGVVELPPEFTMLRIGAPADVPKRAPIRQITGVSGRRE